MKPLASGSPILRQMQRDLTITGEYYTISRVVNRRRVHLEYASDGQPMLWGKEQAEAAIAKAEGA